MTPEQLLDIELLAKRVRHFAVIDNGKHLMLTAVQWHSCRTLAVAAPSLLAALRSAAEERERLLRYVRGSITSQGHTLGCLCEHHECVKRVAALSEESK